MGSANWMARDKAHCLFAYSELSCHICLTELCSMLYCMFHPCLMAVEQWYAWECHAANVEKSLALLHDLCAPNSALP